jgi:hypothetical protein
MQYAARFMRSEVAVSLGLKERIKRFGMAVLAEGPNALGPASL